MIARGENGLAVECDGCGAPGPETDVVIACGGLIGMGWRCTGGTHYCADCAPAVDAAAIPATPINAELARTVARQANP